MYESQILNVYKECGIKTFPIDCHTILSKYGFTAKTYIEASKTTAQVKNLKSYSGDAFTDGSAKTVYYNDSCSPARIRFSLMHEFGHVVLETDDDEAADAFSANILAPRPVIYLKRLDTAEKIHDYFQVSYAAANRALINLGMYFPNKEENEMIKWFRPAPSIGFQFHYEIPKRGTFPEPPADELDKLYEKRSAAWRKMHYAKTEERYLKYRKQMWEIDRRIDFLTGKDLELMEPLI